MARGSTLLKWSKSPLFGGTVIVVLGAWATHLFGPKSEPGPLVESTSPRSTVATLLSASPVSLARWQFRAEGAYPDAAQRERDFVDLLGHQVVWEGYFQQFNDLRAGATEGNRYTLIMYESRAGLDSQGLLGPPFVRCFLPAEAGPELASLRRGQWIVIRGTLANPVLLGSALCTDLRACEIVAAADERNVELAVQPSRSGPALR